MPELVELCFELLAKDPAARPATAKMVAERLDEIGLALSQEEGKVDLAAYMVSTFGDERSATQERIEATMASLAAAPPIARGSAFVHAEPAERTRRPLVFGVVALCLGVATVAAVLLNDNAPQVRTSAEPVAVPPTLAAPTLEAPSVTPIAPPPEPAEPDEPDEPIEPEQPALTEDAPDMSPTRMRRRRNTMRAEMEAASMRSVWMWPDNQ